MRNAVSIVKVWVPWRDFTTRREFLPDLVLDAIPACDWPLPHPNVQPIPNEDPHLAAVRIDFVKWITVNDTVEVYAPFFSTRIPVDPALQVRFIEP